MDKLLPVFCSDCGVPLYEDTPHYIVGEDFLCLPCHAELIERADARREDERLGLVD